MRGGPKLVEEFYQQGLAIYQAGHPLRELMLNAEAFEAREDAEHKAAEVRTDTDRNKLHQDISDHYRGAAQSLITGYADGVIGDIRRAANAGRGLRA
jgi:hypothetical protein